MNKQKLNLFKSQILDLLSENFKLEENMKLFICDFIIDIILNESTENIVEKIKRLSETGILYSNDGKDYGEMCCRVDKLSDNTMYITRVIYVSKTYTSEIERKNTLAHEVGHLFVSKDYFSTGKVRSCSGVCSLEMNYDPDVPNSRFFNKKYSGAGLAEAINTYRTYERMKRLGYKEAKIPYRIAYDLLVKIIDRYQIYKIVCEADETNNPKLISHAIKTSSHFINPNISDAYLLNKINITFDLINKFYCCKENERNLDEVNDSISELCSLLNIDKLKYNNLTKELLYTIDNSNFKPLIKDRSTEHEAGL